MGFIRQMTVIMGICFLAELMEFLLPIPITAGMYGLVILLVGLITKCIPLKRVERAADFLIEIMPLLFVPPTVSVIVNKDTLRLLIVPLLIVCIPTTFLIMGVTGRTAQYMLRFEGKAKRIEEKETSAKKETTAKKGNKRKGNKRKENKRKERKQLQRKETNAKKETNEKKKQRKIGKGIPEKDN